MSTFQKILVPIDFSEHSQRTVDHAHELATSSGAMRGQIHLLHVIGDAPGGEGQVEKIRQRLETLGGTKDVRAELDHEVIRTVIPGEPSTAIIEYAKDRDMDMIIMGTHGRTGLSHFALGSVAERVIRSAVCPVMVMGPCDEERSVSVYRAAVAIGQDLGESFEATREDGIAMMRNSLREQFNLHSARCMRIVDDLLQNEWVVWKAGKPGNWSVVEGVEFVEESVSVLQTESESPAIDLVQRARRLRATDIHIDPSDDNELLVRLRIDGQLEEYCRLNRGVGEQLENQLKTLAELDITQPFCPQEGRLRLPASMNEVEVRITTAPVAAGDAIALRIFDRKNIFLPLDGLGFSEEAASGVNAMLRLGEGLVLVTGPTGSGKTTTVYSMLESLGGIEKNVVSVEDPVEFAVPFVRQMNVDTQHGITMTTGLRTLLRMDPDVVFVGEIRDQEAARIAMQAANSGRYVLSTLHTRDVASTVTALRDMGITDRSAAGNLSGIINQRLLRRLCSNCKRETEVIDADVERFSSAGLPTPTKLFARVGCEVCRGTGFRGRIGVFEVALMSDDVSMAIADGKSEHAIEKLLRSLGVKSLTVDALKKAADGTTSVAEAMSVRWLA